MSGTYKAILNILMLLLLPGCATTMLQNYIDQDKPYEVVKEPAKKEQVYIREIKNGMVSHTGEFISLKICFLASTLYSETTHGTTTSRTTIPRLYEIEVLNFRPGDFPKTPFDNMSEGCDMETKKVSNELSYKPILVLESEDQLAKMDHYLNGDENENNISLKNTTNNPEQIEFLTPFSFDHPGNSLYYVSARRGSDGKLIPFQTQIKVIEKESEALYETIVPSKQRKLLVVFVPLTLVVDIATFPLQLLFITINPIH